MVVGEVGEGVAIKVKKSHVSVLQVFLALGPCSLGTPGTTWDPLGPLGPHGTPGAPGTPGSTWDPRDHLGAPGATGSPELIWEPRAHLGATGSPGSSELIWELQDLQAQTSQRFLHDIMLKKR